ncbi:MAG: Plug domain-containing protein [Bacteroidales bacterium]|nr:Plug domain-containing protein [Bacteroidales bacterium]
MIRSALILLYFLTVVQVLNSQSLKDTINLKEVFVTSARQITENGLQMRSIDSIVIGNSSHTGLSDLLLKNSTLYIKSYGAGGLSTATFRGTAASHTQVLWNGLNINSPLWGQTDLSLLPVFFTDEVSLYYGSSSLAKTSGGLGGCINMNNTPTWNTGTQVSFSQTAGSFGYFLSQLKLEVSKDRFVSNTRIYRDNSRNNFKYFDNATGRNAMYGKRMPVIRKPDFCRSFIINSHRNNLLA